MAESIENKRLKSLDNVRQEIGRHARLHFDYNALMRGEMKVSKLFKQKL